MWSSLLDLELNEEPYKTLGPWRNHWGYMIVLAEFQDGLIIARYVTPQGDSGTAYFPDWEECERFVLMLEADRRF